MGLVRMLINTKARNLGYGWTSQAEQVRRFVNGREVSFPRIADPVEMVRGGLRSVERERALAMRVNAGNDWSESLFVGGRRVVTDSIGCALSTLKRHGSVFVYVEEEDDD